MHVVKESFMEIYLTTSKIQITGISTIQKKITLDAQLSTMNKTDLYIILFQENESFEHYMLEVIFKINITKHGNIKFM